MDSLEGDLREHLPLRATRNAPDLEHAIASALGTISHTGKKRRWLAGAFVAAAVVAIVVVAATVLRGHSRTVPAGQGQVQDKATLVGTTWEAIAFRGSDGPVVELPSYRLARASFRADSVSIPRDCVPVSASQWDIDDGEIIATPDEWTTPAMPCNESNPIPRAMTDIVDPDAGVRVYISGDRQLLTLRFTDGEMFLKRIE